MPSKKIEKATKHSDKKESVIVLEKLPAYFLIACLVLSGALMLWILTPFLTVIFVALVLTVVFYPIYNKFSILLKGWNRLASLITCIIVILVAVVPIVIFIIFLTDETVSTYEIIQRRIYSGEFDKYLRFGDEGGILHQVQDKLPFGIDLKSIDIRGNIISWAQIITTFLVSSTASFLRGLTMFFFKVLIMFFAMFYFFKDGKKLLGIITQVSPLPEVHELEFFQKIKGMINAIVIGVFLTSILQGFIGGVGFAIVGISNPVFWGGAMAIVSLIPMIGPTLIWVPAVIILFILGFYGSALFLLLWGFLIVSPIDNILRPYLMAGKARTYPLITFFVILGAASMMGIKGILIGPIVLMVFMAFLHIYQIEYKKFLKKEFNE